MSNQTPTRTRSEAQLREIAELGAEELGWDATAAEVVAFVAKHLGADEVAHDAPSRLADRGSSGVSRPKVVTSKGTQQGVRRSPQPVHESALCRAGLVARAML